ncbi:hypothetical protein HY797_03970 [Candidatus Falkowbacteria bacterium]|nr:hypothetical protein [Candidatus Falkowbacteria bacterium]
MEGKNFEIKERATDMEIALFLIKHINQPCEYLPGNNIRDFYIREARKILETTQDQDVKKILEDTIYKYQP